MKMKSYILVACASLFAATSCTDLDEKLFNDVPMDGYGQTDAEIQSIVGAAYASLRGYADAAAGGLQCYPCSEFVFFLDECASDEACLPTRGTDWDDNGVYRDLQTHQFKPDNKLFESAWRYAYNGVTNVNSVIYQVEKSGLSEEAMKPVTAELRGLRAYYYYLLLNNFGDVPIVTDFNDTGLPAKSGRKEVYAFIENELNEVMKSLPTGQGYSRFTQNVAHVILARLYLNAETYIGEVKWDDCLKQCEQVTGYSLNPDYFKNFATDNEKNAQEIIFAIPYDYKQGTVGNYLSSMSYNYQQRKAVTATPGGWQWSGNGICAQPGIYSSFDENDTRRTSLLVGEQIDKSTGTTVITDKNNKLIYTEEVDSIYMPDGTVAECQGARLNKYEIREDDQWERDNDWVLMRYAEVLMMQAECNFRLGYASTALPYINQVRERAGLKVLTSLTLEDIDNEWLHEFVFEGLRRTVNIRFGTYFKPWWDKPANSMDEARKTKFYPIPANIITLNPSLVQNPDYAN